MLLGIAAALCLLALVAPAARAGDDSVFRDGTVKMRVPPSWTVTGEGGEYTLESGADVASLLLLPPDPDQPLEVRLAEIEEQFLSTGIIKLEASEKRPAKGDSGQDVSYRRYRLVAGPSKGATTILLHQYSFDRSAVRVLLQVETPPEGGGQEKLFESIHGSLEVLRAPDPFEEDLDPFAAADSEAADSGAPPESSAAPPDSVRP